MVATNFREASAPEKELFWIKNTKKRFKDGYNYFGRHPEKIIAFFDKRTKRSPGKTEQIGAEVYANG